MIREALATYGRNFRVFLLASCLLCLPVEGINQVQAVITVHGGWAFSTAAEVMLQLAGTFAFIVTGAALTILAADLQTGGHWGWRGAWSRALVRTRPVVTGYLAFILLVATPAFFIVYTYLSSKSDLPQIPTSIVLPGIGLLLCPLSSLIAPVATVESRGGFGSAGRIWRLLRTSFRWRATAALVLVNVPALFAHTAFTALWPGHPTVARWFGTAMVMLSNPVIVLVALAVYRRARAEQEPFTDAELRSTLNAI